MSRTRDRLEKLASTEYSAAEYSALFDAVAENRFGPTVKEALAGICEAIDNTSTVSEKTASVYDGQDFSESEARKMRLDQLLRR